MSEIVCSIRDLEKVPERTSFVRLPPTLVQAASRRFWTGLHAAGRRVYELTPGTPSYVNGTIPGGLSRANILDLFGRTVRALLPFALSRTSNTNATTNETYRRKFARNREPRYEVRSRWPRGSPRAKPWGLVRGKSGAKLELSVEFHGGRRHLPIVSLRRAA